MPSPWSAKTFPRRLPATQADLDRMAWAPSYRAPSAREVLHPGPQPPTPPGLDAALARWSARDVERDADGRVVGLSLSGRAFLAGGGELLAVAPLKAVRLVAVAPYLGELARCPHLAGLERLDLSGNRIGADGLRTLGGSPHLAALHDLDLSRNDLGPDGLRLLLETSWAKQLERLNLAGNGLTAADLPDPAALPGVVALNLSANPLGPAAGDRLAGWLSRLGWLHLEGVGLGPAGADALARSPGLPAVLDLGFNRLGDAGLAAVVGSPGFRRVAEFVARGNFLTPAAARLLADRGRHLRRLDVSANPAVAAAESHRPPLPGGSAAA